VVDQASPLREVELTEVRLDDSQRKARGNWSYEEASHPYTGTITLYFLFLTLCASRPHTTHAIRDTMDRPEKENACETTRLLRIDLIRGLALHRTREGTVRATCCSLCMY
jgi:hypothetical protein